MGFRQIQKLPTPEEIKALVPIPTDLKNIKAQRDLVIRAVLEKTDDRFVVVIGPCSAHDENSVCEYVARLAKVQELIREKVVLIPRIYTNKPRTTGQGYKGMAHQPDPLKGPNMTEGINAIRKMHLRALSESHLTAADEMLYPNNHPYLEDMLSYVAVGARSVENQQHRLTASGLDIPVGMKNPTSGDLNVALNSVLAAQLPHVFSYNGWEVETAGNQFAHLILRGAIDHYGQVIPNYHYEDLISVAQDYEQRKLLNPVIFIDTNHDNSGKRYKEQPRICLEILQSRKYSPLLHNIVRGVMIESFLEEGNQKAEDTVYGKSITDPCIGWDDTERLLKDIAENC
jgi:3-deoxy-7-phosphoheptulonate synthase